MPLCCMNTVFVNVPENLGWRVIALGGKCDCTLPPIYRDVVEILGQTCSRRLAQTFEAIFPGEHLTCLGGDCWQRALRTNHVPLCRGADVGFIGPDCRSSIRSNHERSKKKSQILSSNSPPRIHPHFRLPKCSGIIMTRSCLRFCPEKIVKTKSLS